MDLSYCCKIGPRGLTAIGKRCKSLVGLRRNMHPMDINERRRQDEEVAAIAGSMPKLKHLEMAYNCIDTESVVQIIKSCPELELLDVRGCWDVDLNPDWPDWPDWLQNWLQKWAPKIRVLGPHVEDGFEVDDWLSGSEYSYDSADDGVWNDDFDLLGGSNFELDFYELFDDREGNGWLPSP